MKGRTTLTDICALASSGLQNAHAPLPLTAHIIFCVIATFVYIIQYTRKSLNYYLYLLIAVDLTILTQFFEQDYFIIILGVAEIILLAMAFVSSRKNKKRLRQEAEEQLKKDEMEKGKADGEAVRADVRKINKEDIPREE